MAFGMKNFRLGATMQFNAGNALSQMSRTSRMFAGLQKSAMRLRTGMMKMSAGFAAIRFLPTGFSNAVRGAIKTSMDFEQQMKAVQAVSGATGEEYTALTEEAKRLGIVSAFSAQEAAEGMEFLARAGFNTGETIAAIGPVLNAAAADNITLAESANIVSNVLKGMGMQVSDAARVANVLALTSASANTNIIGLGEAFKFAGAQASDMGFELEETAAALGLMANAGLKGSVAGTSFTNMMVKLTKPSQKATAFMEKYKISLTDAGGKMKDLSDVVSQFIPALSKIKDDAKRAAMATEIFGIRGNKAFSALRKAGVPALIELQSTLEGANEGIGAAGRMAAIRLDNLAGALTLFKSSVQAFSIETVSAMGLPLKEGMQGITNFLNTMIFTLKGATKKEMKALFQGMAGTPMVLLETAKSIGTGIKDFFGWFQGAWERTSARLQPALAWVDSLSDRTKKLFGFIAIGVPIIAGLLTPLIAMAGLLVPAIGAGLAILSGLGSIALAIFIPLIKPIALTVLLLKAMKKPGESLGQTFIRTFKTASEWIVAFGKDFWKVFKPIAMFVGTELKAVWIDLVGSVSESFGIILKALEPVIGKVGEGGSLLAGIIGIVSLALVTTAKLFSFVIKNVARTVANVFWLGNVIRETMFSFWEGIKTGFNSLVSFVKPVAETILNTLLGPMRGLSKMISMLLSIGPIAASAKVLGFDVAGTVATLKKFAEQGVSLAVGGLVTKDMRAQLHKNEVVIPMEKFRKQIVPEIIERAPVRTAEIHRLETIRETLRAEAPMIRPEISVHIPELDQEVIVRNIIQIDGRELARVLGRAEIESATKVGRILEPNETRALQQTGFRSGR